VDARRAAENTEFMSSLMDSMPDGYGSLEQLIAGFVPSQSVPGTIYENVPDVPISNGMATGILQQYQSDQ